MKHTVNKWVVRVIAGVLGVTAISITLFIFIYVFFKGRTVISLEFLTEAPSGIPFGTEGGIFPALMGSLALGAVSGILGGVLGVFTALYLSFYTRNSIIYSIVMGSITLLSGLPSIVFGLVGYTFLIYQFGMPKSLLCAALTITVMIIPFVTIRSKKVLDEKGLEGFKESLCQGLEKSYIIRKLILPYCMPELLGCVTLGMSYGMGAVAPIMYTGVVMQAASPTDLTSPFMSLPYHLYTLVNSGYSDEYAYGTAFVLLVLLIGIQLLVRAFGKTREGAQWKRIRRQRR